MANQQTPKLTTVRHSNPYCEECREELQPGWAVAWWRVRGANGRLRKTAFCAACHRDRKRMLEAENNRKGKRG